MTSRALAILFAASALAPRDASADGPRPERASDFKLVTHLYGVAKEAISRADMVVRKGVAYQFLSDSPGEVVVIETAASRVVLLDLDRGVQTSVSVRKLDANLGRIHRKTSAEIERRRKTGAKGDQVAAAMSRDLITPDFTVKRDADGSRVFLNNPSVAVEAVCVDEPDTDRLNMTINCLAAVSKLGAFRDAEIVPPFTTLDALRAVASSQKVRPVEVTYLYRLAGPPRKLRWTYQLVPGLTEAERTALDRIDKVRAETPVIPFDKYEEQGDEK